MVDFDFSSMYPNVIITFNIAPNCMIGKLIIERDEPYKAYDYKEPPSLKDKKKKNLTINYNFYISETNKIINAVYDGQLSLF